MKRMATLSGATLAGLIIGNLDVPYERFGEFLSALLLSPVLVVVGSRAAGQPAFLGPLFWPVWSLLAWRWCKWQHVATVPFIVAWSALGSFRLLERFDMVMSA